MPAPAITRAVSRANTSLLRRASYPITTPRSAALRVEPEQVVGEPGRGLAHDQPVHPQRPGADRGTQPRRAELQPAGETLGQHVAGSAGHRLLELGADVGVGLGGQPPLRGDEIVVGRLVRRVTEAPQSERSRARVQSRHQRTQLDQWARTDVADHLGGRDRPKPGAFGERFAAW